jgi:hypothetical protein
MVLHGGTAGTARFGDSWEWDGLRWREITSPAGPAFHTSMATGFDPLRGKCLFLGGSTATAQYTNTEWEWDGAQWSQATAMAFPVARAGGVMAYDTVRSRLVLHGGTDANGNSGQTWEHDGSTWTLATTTLLPRFGFVTMAFDATRQCCVLVGRVNGATETWEWNGSQWVQRNSGWALFGPLCSAYDTGIGKVVLGGYLTAYLQLWDWNGQVWTARPAAQGPVQLSGDSTAELLYDAVRGRITRLATYMDHFGTHPPAVVLTGQACGSPRMDVIEAPTVGESQVRLELAAPQQPTALAAFVLGFADGSMPVVPGCSLAMSSIDAVVLTVTSTIGRAGLALPLPLLPGLAGLSLNTQALVLDAVAANGLAVTDGRRLVIGQ